MIGNSPLDRTFRVSLILKGLDGVLEMLGGLLLLVVSPAMINQIVVYFTQGELSEDPKDHIANYLLTQAHHLSATTALFGALYLLSHGLLKVVLVTAVLKDKLWAYPWTMAFLVAFIVYQSYRLTIHFSVGLLLLTVFDIFVVALTWIEYGRHRAARV